MNQALNIPELSPEVSLLLQQKETLDNAILDINNLVVSKNDLLYQKDNVIAQNTKIIAQRDATIYDLQFQLAQLRRAIFGSKSERHVPEKVKQLYDALKYKYAPFKKKKSVVHKSELEDSQLIEQHDFLSD